MDNVQVVITGADGKVVLDETADARTFASGKTGFGSYGKVKVGPDRYQLSFNLVKIEPKS